MLSRVVSPLAGLMLLAVCSLSSLADEISWRPLKIEGAAVRWIKPADTSGRQVLTWRIVTGSERFAGATNCKAMTSPEVLLAGSNLPLKSFREELGAAFEMWEISAGVSFVEAKPGMPADISIGAQMEPEGRAFADVAFDRQSDSAVRAISRSLICLNPTVRWKVGFDGNLDVYDLRYTFAHEIGHAIGLDHPRQRGTLMWFRYDETLRGLQPGDIEGATALYGAAPNGLAKYARSQTMATRRD